MQNISSTWSPFLPIFSCQYLHFIPPKKIKEKEITNKNYKPAEIGKHSPYNSEIPEAIHSLSLKASCNSSGTNRDLHSGHVLWSWSIHRSRQFLWNMCRQFVSRRISSSPLNSYKQTAQFSGGTNSFKSENFTTGRSSRISTADTELGCSNPESGNAISDSKKSPKPSSDKTVEIDFPMKPRTVRR